MVRKITALKQQKRNPRRVSIYLDGEFAFGLSRIVAAWLQVGHELDDEKIATLQAEDEYEVAYQRAIKFISYRIRTELEIKRHLTKNHISTDVITETLKRLRRNVLVDDKQFAKSWVENRNEFRPRAHRMLANELRQKGIVDDVIIDTLDGSISNDELAYHAARKQAHKYTDLEWPDFRRRMNGFLARRGFYYDIISLVTDQIWTELRSQDQTSGAPNIEVSS